MAARGNLSVKQQKVSQGFRRALASAVLEWLLIFFLFIDAILAFLITRFAHYCKLQTPCLLCSRLDHVLGNQKLNYYWDLICGKHKLEISSLVFCHAHNKLVDVHGMCENCLLSFATINKSNAETYRLLVGKVGDESGFGCDEDPLLEGQQTTRSSIKHCSCCNEPWISRVSVEQLIQHKSIDFKTSEFDVPLSGAGRHNLNYVKRSDKPSASNRVSHPRSGVDALSHVGYRELKISSDTESELLSDDDDYEAIALIHETDVHKEDLAAQLVQLDPFIITRSNDSALERLIDPVYAVAPSLLDSKEKSDVIDTRYGTSIASIPAGGHGLEELNWEKADFKADHSLHSNIISVDNVCSSSNAEKTSIDVSKESKFISLDAVLTSPNAGKASTVVSKESKFISLDAALTSPKESELIYHDVPSLSNSTEYPVDVSRESKLISIDEVPLSSTAVDAADKSKLISVDEVPLSSNVVETLVDAADKSNLISVDEVPRASNAVETPVDSADKSKLISIDEVPLSSNAVETPVGVPGYSILISLSSNDRDTSSEVSKDSKVIFTDDTPLMSSAMESPVKAPKENCVTRSVELQETSVTGNEEICKAGSVPNTSNETALERNPILNDTGLQPSNLLDLSDAYKVAVSNRGRQLAGVLAEQWSIKDSSRLSEDLKLLLTQLSAARGFDQLSSDMSPKKSINSDEVKTSDASSSNGMQILQKMISLERNESGLESLDGTAVSEIEGENLVDRLKRQIEHDKKLLTAVYKELEEERNASTVAVNQAMAMITRLQEEKASLHMEALQNLRMMEEQAEYDMEALQNTNDLLAEKEKEIQDLEDEIEFYRKKYPNESMLENVMASTHDLETREMKMDHSEVTCVKESASADTKSVTGTRKTNTLSEDMNSAALKNPLLDFEDERLYILQNLKKLEKKLYMFSYNGLSSDFVNGRYNVNEGDEVSDSKDLSREGDSQLNSEAEVKDSPMLNDASTSKGSTRTDVHDSSLENPQLIRKENIDFDYSGQCSPVACTGTDLAALGNEKRRGGSSIYSGDSFSPSRITKDWDTKKRLFRCLTPIHNHLKGFCNTLHIQKEVPSIQR
ncbi:hypothetical protein LWI28_005687 [Acer negundo]|uniref:GTD-binding domain-containing protein n=1 Tax=Acer negundo TaxID=4023 RepID=A0AAD5J3F4_ACENE|nr:hypothetical protein LWI28_005687 [Acer negundo]KAK4850794.1 hypothetical protein QYF36_009870 [Acer negundo]